VDLQLHDKHVVVAGGSRGIGLAIVKAFLAEKAQVHILARNTMDSTLEELRQAFGASVYFYPCDVTDQLQLNAAAANIREIANSGIDVLVANVGSGKSVQTPLPEEEQWHSVWNTNFDAARNSVYTFGEDVRRRSGSIIFISSIAGIEFIGAPTDYTVAKAALIALSKTLAHKLAPTVRVNVIAPGNIYFEGGSWEKRMQENPEKIEKFIQDKVPLKRFGRPDEIADLVLFLSSDKAAFITGSCIVADGGQTIKF
jgi:3-oxoacyl-[acyl-carrier protein] reductase